jgi:hypothetical protein
VSSKCKGADALTVIGLCRTGWNYSQQINLALSNGSYKKSYLGAINNGSKVMVRAQVNFWFGCFLFKVLTAVNKKVIYPAICICIPSRNLLYILGINYIPQFISAT